MNDKALGLDAELARYLRGIGFREAPVLARLRAATQSLPMARMQIAPEQGAFMQLLAKLMGVRRYLEVGVFTGYSALAVALALPDDGRVIACDINEDWTGLAREYWQQAGVAAKIDLRLAPALHTLDALLATGQADSFDFVFVDADKPNYDGYYERALRLVRPGGLIAIDNVLWHGAVADPARNDADTVAIRALNAKLHDDPRIDLSLLPIADGLTLALKRSVAGA
jgi:caffeoyl-CoA O-methyltransferase